MSEGSSRTCPHPDSSLTSGTCPAQSLCLGQSPHLLQGVAHVASSVTPCLPLQLPNLPDPAAHLSANLIFLIIPCAHLSGHLAVSQGWEHPENRGFVCFGHCCIVGARTGLRCAEGSVPACQRPHTANSGAQSGLHKWELDHQTGSQTGLWLEGALWRAMFPPGAGRGCLPVCRALAKLSRPLDKPRNVHIQTRSFPASLPLGGASCTHTQFRE